MKQVMKRKLAFALPLAFVLFLIPAVSYSGSLKSIEGTIRDVGSSSITLAPALQSSQTSQSMETSELKLEIGAQTQFQKVDNAMALKTGDKVKVEYREDGDKKIATLVSFIQPGTAQATTEGTKEGANKPMY